MSVLFFSTSATAASWLYPTTGSFQIESVQVTGADSYHFRILNLEQQANCDNKTWVFINESDSGAKGKISTLLTAYSAGHYVRLRLKDYVYGTNTYCQIDEIFTSKNP